MLGSRPAPLLLFLAPIACSSAPAGPDPASVFAPETQTPLFERGLIVPPDSIPCVRTATSAPINECNHHGSSIAELPDGTIATVWYHGVAEKSWDSRLLWSRLAPGAREWTTPAVLFDDPGRAEGNPAIHPASDGSLLVFFVTIVGQGWDDARPRIIRSVDGGSTWSAPVDLHDDNCLMVRAHPLEMSDGQILLPLYHECLAQPVFMLSADGFRSAPRKVFPYEESGDGFLARVGQIQPAVIERADGTLLAMMRNGTGHRRISRMTSADKGKTWTRADMSGLPNSGTSVDLVRLLDGHVVVVFNNSPHDRFPLSVALSTDEGATFGPIRSLVDACDPDHAPCSFHYPSIAQSRRDGSIWVSYTHDRRTIGWVRFNEAWLAQGTEPAVVSCPSGQVCVGGSCAGICDAGPACPAAESVTRARCVP